MNRRQLSYLLRDGLAAATLRRRQPVFVLGHQKSGTTALAALLARRGGVSYSHDMIYRRGWSNRPIFHDGAGIAHFVKKSPFEFSRCIVKEPDFSFVVPSIFDVFPGSRVLLVLREPFDNIRSVLNRLDIPGSYTGGDIDDFPQLRRLPLWVEILRSHRGEGENTGFVENLARRWQAIARVVDVYGDRIRVVKYEEFVQDKIGVLDDLLASCGIPDRHDVEADLDTPFQPRGQRVDDLAAFFGPVNSTLIDKICGRSAAARGYLPQVRVPTGGGAL